VSRLLARAGRRFLLRHPGQLALATAGIALGVAVVVGVDLANDSARRGFELSAALVTGRATHQFVGVHGTLPDASYVRLRRDWGIDRAAPVIEAPVRLPAAPERAFTLLGVDPLAEAPLRDEVTPGTGGLDLARLLTTPGTVVLPRPLADELDAQTGSRFALVAGGREQEIEVAGVVEVDRARREAAGAILFADIATAQELTGMIGRITRIDLVLSPAEAARLESLLPADELLLPAESQSQAIVEMTRAFRINLTALSLLALVVGVFLIHATLSFLAVRRRQAIGTARALGVTRRQLFGVTLAEALALGAVGTAMGLLLGHLLGTGLTQLVLRTIEDLYYAQTAAVRPAVWIYIKGALLGLGATVIAALAPALAAGRIPPRALQSRAALEQRTRKRLPALAIGGAVVAAIAAAILMLDTQSLVVAFAGLFAVIAAAALLIPALTPWVIRWLQAPAAWIGGLPGRLTARAAAASLSRTGVAVTALAVATATVTGIGLMIASFRGNVGDWLDQTLQADFHMRIAPGIAAVDSEALSPDAIAMLRRLPGVAGLSLARWSRIPTGDSGLQLRAIEPGPEGWGLRIVEGDPDAARAAFERGTEVVISESLARRREMAVGDRFELPAATGPVSFQVAGVFRDFSSDRGAVVMQLAAFRRHWQDESLSGVGVYLVPGADAAAARQAIERFVAASGELDLAASAELRAVAMQIFDRSFTITEVLRWLAGLVAFFGILSSLLALELERTREIGVLRALGFVPAQIRTLIIGQTSLLGLVAGLFAIPLGVVLAGLLVYVVNERAFGWSMDFAVTPSVLGTGVLMALVAAVAAGLAPAWRLARLPLAAALREE
jgi:putative ABC transport system permease protein